MGKGYRVSMVLVASAIAVGVLAGCGGSGGAKGSTTIKICTSLPVSGADTSAGKPAENGRHERMHRTLKAEATKPPRANLDAQQRQFNRFQREFNDDRPHHALGFTPPATHYTPSPRPYPRRLPEIHYSDQHELRLVDNGGHFKWRNVRIFAPGRVELGRAHRGRRGIGVRGCG